jgi:hypothetical protein
MKSIIVCIGLSIRIYRAAGVARKFVRQPIRHGVASRQEAVRSGAGAEQAKMKAAGIESGAAVKQTVDEAKVTGARKWCRGGFLESAVSPCESGAGAEDA